jgi:hypothetical protein
MVASGVMAGFRPDAALAADFGAAPPPAPVKDDRAQAIGCMATAILYEAGFEPSEGQEAVAEVILNRLHNPAFPKTVCGVIFQGSDRGTGCQFSFTCDGSMNKTLPMDAVLRARAVATHAIDGELAAHTAGATHYHADYVSPYWAPSLVRLTSIGRHIFYRLPGASPFSALARYNPAGEHMPLTLGGSLAGTAPAAAAAAPTEKPKEPERFMPWGLSPAALAQAASASKQ